MSQNVTTLGTGLSEPSSAETFANIMNVLLGMGGILLIFGGFIIPWVLAIFQVIRRDDLKESKLLWIILLFIVGPIGVLMYAFMEDRKKLGYVSLAFYIGLPVILVLFAIVTLLVS